MVSSVDLAIRKTNGIAKKLSLLGYSDKTVYGRYRYNKLLIKFLKLKGVKYEKLNPRFKGFWQADLINSIVISDNYYDEFVQWAKDNITELDPFYQAKND